MKPSSFLWLLLPLVTLIFLLAMPDLSMMQDLGRHLKMGQMIISCHCVLHTNYFSFTEPNFPFIDHHWFSEVIFYWLYSVGGLGLLTIMKIVAIATSFGMSFYLAYRKAGLRIASILAVFFLFIFSERFYTRPELISFICLGMFLWVIDEFKTKEAFRYLWTLPLVELWWVNSHIYFPVGVGLVFLLLIEQLIHKSKHWAQVTLIFIITGAVTVLNPNGLTGMLYPLHILDHYGYTIVENQSVFFLNTVFFNAHILVFEIMAILFIMVAALQIRKLDFFWLSASILAMISSFMMIRNFSLFILVALPYTAQLIYQFISDKKPTFQRATALTGAIAAIFIVVIVSYSRLTFPGPWFSYQPGAEKAVVFFQKAGLKGPIFNNFDIGSYLIFRLFPQEKVFVDGRPEAYSVSFFDMYRKMQEDPAYFNKMVNRYHLNTIVFAHSDVTPWAQTFVAHIIHDPHWVPVYLDNVMIILVKNVPENKKVINQYKISLQS